MDLELHYEEQINKAKRIYEKTLRQIDRETIEYFLIAQKGDILIQNIYTPHRLLVYDYRPYANGRGRLPSVHYIGLALTQKNQKPKKTRIDTIYVDRKDIKDKNYEVVKTHDLSFSEEEVNFITQNGAPNFRFSRLTTKQKVCTN